MRAAAFTFLSLTIASSTPVFADPLGEHPAVLVQRLYAKQGYDYASKFYPHPAWLWLYAEAPRPMMDHPAVIIAKRQRESKSQMGLPCCPAPAEVAAGSSHQSSN